MALGLNGFGFSGQGSKFPISPLEQEQDSSD